MHQIAVFQAPSLKLGKSWKRFFAGKSGQISLDPTSGSPLTTPSHVINTRTHIKARGILKRRDLAGAEYDDRQVDRQGGMHVSSKYYYWSLLYSAILRSQADSLRSHVILHEWIAFYSAFLNIHRSGVLTALAWPVPRETAAISARSVYTIQPCTMSLHAKPHT